MEEGKLIKRLVTQVQAPYSEVAEIRNPARAAAQRQAGGFLIKPGTGSWARRGAGAGRFLIRAVSYQGGFL